MVWNRQTQEPGSWSIWVPSPIRLLEDPGREVLLVLGHMRPAVWHRVTPSNAEKAGAGS